MSIDSDQKRADRQASVDWSKSLLSHDGWVILDTETSGLEQNAEIIQIGVINSQGETLMDNVLVHPLRRIPESATKIHHITNEMVEGADTFRKVWPRLEKILATNNVVIYNADYDVRLLRQTAYQYSITIPKFKVRCAMLLYAAFVGDWNEYKGGYKWQKLYGGDHSAVGDCRATLALIRKMAAAIQQGVML